MLSLSNGNFDGLGRVREKELEQSCKLLKFEEAPIIINDPDLPDGMQSKWPKELVSSQIEKVLRSMAANGYAIDIVISFDEGGVSGHPNHIDVYRGLMHLSKKSHFAFDYMTLESVSIFRKYLSFTDIMWCNEFAH